MKNDLARSTHNFLKNRSEKEFASEETLSASLNVCLMFDVQIE